MTSAAGSASKSGTQNTVARKGRDGRRGVIYSSKLDASQIDLYGPTYGFIDECISGRQAFCLTADGVRAPCENAPAHCNVDTNLQGRSTQTCNQGSPRTCSTTALAAVAPTQ